MDNMNSKYSLIARYSYDPKTGLVQYSNGGNVFDHQIIRIKMAIQKPYNLVQNLNGPTKYKTNKTSLQPVLSPV